VNAQQILIRGGPRPHRAARRPAGRGRRPSCPSGFDEGTDIVATARPSSVPIDGRRRARRRASASAAADPRAGQPSGFEVVALHGRRGRRRSRALFGTDGRILDLTPTGNPVIGNPSQQLPRERAVTVPSLPPRFSDQKPAAPPAVDSEQVLAFLRCGGALTTCDAQAAASLATLTDFDASTLATERATDLAARYRALRSRDLSAAFDAAGTGFRQASDFGEFDPQAFGAYLEATREHEPARTAIHELATLLVEIDLLGLAPEVEAQLRRDLASDLAHEANLPGFDADAVLTPAAATPSGFLRSEAPCRPGPPTGLGHRSVHDAPLLPQRVATGAQLGGVLESWSELEQRVEIGGGGGVAAHALVDEGAVAQLVEGVRPQEQDAVAARQRALEVGARGEDALQVASTRAGSRGRWHSRWRSAQRLRRGQCNVGRRWHVAVDSVRSTGRSRSRRAARVLPRKCPRSDAAHVEADGAPPRCRPATARSDAGAPLERR
jgi:hypothetical protein